VLIPRPETEGMVDRVLQGARPDGVVVDVCTGSGCVALSLRQEGAFRVVVGTDRSPEALAVARDNRDRLELDVRLVRGDLATAFGESVADAVVANPPYVSAGEYEALDPAVRDHEPREALLSGPDGLAATRALLGQAERALRPRGLLALELATERAAAVAALATAGGWSDVRIEEDLTGRARYLVALRRER
jgi:release factor glutamine methyltransferase